MIFADSYANPKFALVELGNVVTQLQYGLSILATDEPIGLPILRMNNLQADGWDLSDLKYVNLSTEEARSYLLKPGDILFNRTNSKELVGKCEVFQEQGDWVFASYLIRVRADESRALPDFVTGFLNTKAGRLQIDMVSRQIVGMSNVNAQEIRALQLPLPPLATQRALVAELQTARGARRQKLAQADGLLAGLDGFLLEQLGIARPREDKRQVFATRLGDAKTRYDADYHSPRFRNLRKAIGEGLYPLHAVGEICESLVSGFAAGRQDQAFDNKEGIPHVRPLNITSDGEFTLDGTKYVPRANVTASDLLTRNEVLFNNTNSTELVGKSTVFDGRCECACSNHITRLKLKANVAEPHFVAEVLNALQKSGVFGLLSTNFNNQAGINTQTLSAFQIPVPPLESQREIAAIMKQRRERARRLRAEASEEWDAAEARFERNLIGEGHQ